jgi:hypothetical protein
MERHLLQKHLKKGGGKKENEGGAGPSGSGEKKQSGSYGGEFMIFNEIAKL